MRPSRVVRAGQLRRRSRGHTAAATARALVSDGESPADFEAVFHGLVDNRLLTTTKTSGSPVLVDIAHEVLISAWRTLADRIRSWRADEQDRRGLEAAAIAWRVRGGRGGGLLDAFELKGAEKWRSKAAEQLGHSAGLTAFLVASKAAIRRAQASMGGVVAALLVFSGLVLVRNVVERNHADWVAAIAEVQGAEAVRAEELLPINSRDSIDRNRPARSQ